MSSFTPGDAAAAHVVSPFPDGGSARDAEDESDANMQAAARILRQYDGAWTSLTLRCGLAAAGGLAGSFARELVVLMDTRGVPTVMDSLDSAMQAIQQLQVVLNTHRGMGSGRAHIAATDLVCAMAEGNRAILRAARRVLHGAVDVPSVDALVVRVSLRSMNAMGAGSEHAWFRCTHANALLMRRGSCVLIEPMAPSPMPVIVRFLQQTLSPGTMLCTQGDHWAPVSNLALCTLGAAVLTLCLLKNDALAQTPQGVHAITQWVYMHQHWLLRRLVADILSDARTDAAPPPPSDASTS